MNKKKVWVLVTVAFLLVASAAWAAQTKAPTKAAAPNQGAKSGAKEKPKEHQATGSVVSSSATSLVISKAAGKKKSDWAFVLTSKTKTTGTVAKNAKATVYYHEDKDQKVADRVKVSEAKPEGKAPVKAKASKSKS